MSANKFKISAYSLSEILVAMFIMIIVLGFVLFGVRYFQYHTQLFSERIENKNKLIRMEQIFWNDIHHFARTNLNAQDSVFTFGQPMKQVFYRFKNNEIWRNNQLLLDDYVQLVFYYEGQRVLHGRFDAIALDVRINSTLVNYFFTLPSSVQLYTP